MKRLFYPLIACVMAHASLAQAENVKRDIPYAEPANGARCSMSMRPKMPRTCRWSSGFTEAAGRWVTRPACKANRRPLWTKDSSSSLRTIASCRMSSMAPRRHVAKSIRWVHDHIAEHGGDPQRLFIMGHSAGAQLAALVCTDDRYLKAEGLSLAIVKGCVPVDGDTYDVPLIIETAAARRKAPGKPDPKFGHYEKFGSDPAKHRDYSAVNHVTRDKGIPPFLLLCVADHPDAFAQARRLGDVLSEAGIAAKVFGAKDTDHTKINANLGLPDDPSTKALFEFVDEALKK